MIKTLCLLALVALAVSQDAGQTVQTAVDNSAVGSESIQSVANNINGTVGQISSTGLKNLTVGWENRNVILSPDYNGQEVTNDNWIANWEELDIERAVGAGGDGEWLLNWSTNDGVNWAVWNQNSELLLVDWENGSWNQVANLGSDVTLGGVIASNAEQLVDSAYNSGADSVSNDDVSAQVDNLVNQVLNSGQLNNWLGQQGQSTDATLSSVVNSVVSDPQQAVQNAQNVAGTA